MECKSNVKKAVLRESLRIVAFVVAATALLIASSELILPDAAMAPLMTSTSLVMYLAAFTHVTRRILFPYIDLEEYAKSALSGNVAAGVVVAAVIFIMATCIEAGVGLLR